MARPTNRLTARAVQTAAPGYHADGAGLYLLVADEGTASWVFRYTLRGKKREMGLGSAALFSLAEARERAQVPRRQLADGLDPIEHRRALRAAKPRLWGEAAAEFIQTHKAAWRNADQAVQWEQSLRDYGPSAELPITQVTTDVVLDCLRSIWRPKAEGGKVETATRVRGRIERIWDAEKVRGNIAGENPARWRGHLEHLLPRASKLGKGKHFAAMPYAEVPALMADLRTRDGLARRAMRFTILTLARTNETTGADWPELDLKKRLWTIPGERMKAGEEHIVPLVDEVIDLLRELPRDKPPFPLSEGGMLALLQQDLARPYTVHGFRSSFHDWASEQTEFQDHIIDMSLAHKVSDEVKAAYRRTTLLAKRRDLMTAWAAYCAGGRTKSKV